MVELQLQLTLEEQTLLSEAEILRRVLGEKSGYVGGVGYGPKSPRKCEKFIPCQPIVCEIQEKLSTTKGLLEEQQVEYEKHLEELLAHGYATMSHAWKENKFIIRHAWMNMPIDMRLDSIHYKNG